MGRSWGDRGMNVKIQAGGVQQIVEAEQNLILQLSAIRSWKQLLSEAKPGTSLFREQFSMDLRQARSCSKSVVVRFRAAILAMPDSIQILASRMASAESDVSFRSGRVF